MGKQTYVPYQLQQQAIRSKPNARNVVHRKDLILYHGRISDVFTVSGGPVMVTAMVMRITEAITNSASNMAWVYDPTVGAANVTIGSALDVANFAIGDLIWAELDGTALVKVAQNALLKNFSGIGDNTAIANSGRGLWVPEGGIDITMSAHAALLVGKAEMWIEYEPFGLNTQSKIWPGVIHSTTTTTTTTTTSTTSSSTTTTAPP